MDEIILSVDLVRGTLALWRMSTTDVAHAIGVHPSYLRRVLAEHEPLTAPMAERLSGFLRLPVEPSRPKVSSGDSR